MSVIAANITNLRKALPENVRLVAVSKTKSAFEIMEAYNAGQRLFGENRVQELLSKKDLLPSDIEWHMIGHLQRNKVKNIVPFVSMIESVDSFRLLEVINAEASKINRKLNVLLQMHIATEETKFGFSLEEIRNMLVSPEFTEMKNVTICGLMGMATFSSDDPQVRNEFRSLYESFRKLKLRYFSDDYHFREISMGMSGDYRIALEEGSTIIRVGSLIFGERTRLTPGVL
jgi:PLP dependent protein